VPYNQLVKSISCQTQEKSKRKKTIAFLFLTTGTIGLSAGISLFDKSNSLEDAVSGVGLMLTGGSFVLYSIPFFLRASKLKKRSMSFTIGSRSIPFRINDNSSVQQTISCRFIFGK
jgi:hypothetical protein